MVQIRHPLPILNLYKENTLEFVGIELIFIHILLSAPLFLPPLLNLYSLSFSTTHTKKLRTLALVAPGYYTLLSASLFSGLVIWAMLGFIFNFKILVMLIVWLIVFILEIIRHKRQKLAKIEADSAKRVAFFKFAFLKNVFDFCAFLALFVAFL